MHECPICLSILISPITLSCGHTYCEPSINNSLFRHTKNVCPICRKKILIKVSFFEVDVILDQILCQKFDKEKNYRERRAALRKIKYPKNLEWLEYIKKWMRQKLPWVIVVLLLYHLVRVKLNVFNMLFEKYKSKALGIANEIKKENSLDFKFILFSQFIRILFSNLVVA